MDIKLFKLLKLIRKRKQKRKQKIKSKLNFPKELTWENIDKNMKENGNSNFIGGVVFPHGTYDDIKLELPNADEKSDVDINKLLEDFDEWAGLKK